MPKIFCHKCGAVHEKGVCSKTDTPSDNPIPITPMSQRKRRKLCELEGIEKLIEQFYKSKEWKKKREVIIERCNGLCEICFRCGVIKEGREVHHIIKLRDDFDKRLDDDNLILVCSTCHKEVEDCCSSVEDLIKFIKEKKKKNKRNK